jgi:hypothetical protein
MNSPALLQASSSSRCLSRRLCNLQLTPLFLGGEGARSLVGGGDDYAARLFFIEAVVWHV